ncbi:MAG: hypothetical protein ACLR56_00140 [Oscillospiraceae bacterium]
MSHILTSPSSTLLSGLSTVAAMLTGIVLTVGLMVIHEFSFPKFLGSILLTAFAMLLIIFIIFMLGMLLSQLWSFGNRIHGNRVQIGKGEKCYLL